MAVDPTTDMDSAAPVKSAKPRVTVEQLLANPINFFALGAGSGLARFAPGTFGTLAAIPLVFLMPSNVWLYAGLMLVLFVLGVWICDRCADNLGVHDHPAIVFDEWVGYLITMIVAPRSLLFVALAFALFRLFDILKPWPISWLDKQVDGGLGIMVDDVIAGIFAAIVLQIIIVLMTTYGVVI